MADHQGALRSDPRMSDAEAMMWRLERDPALSSTFGSVLVLDRMPDMESLRARMRQAIADVAHLRRKVHTIPLLDAIRPTWVDDPDFDLDRHVRRATCPKPGRLEDLLELAEADLAEPLDRSHPLWTFTIVDGLRGGKAGVIQKMHHTITDGERGIELGARYLDVERDAPDPRPSDRPEPDPATAPNPLAELIEAGLRLPLGVARQVGRLLAEPERLPEAAESATRTMQGVVGALTDRHPARSPIWTERSLRRKIVPVRAPFRPVKDAAARLGGTLNTAFLTAASHAAADYHEQMGAPVDHLRASMVISTRTARSGANAFSLARLLVPTAPMPIAERFHLISAITDAAREENRTQRLDTLATIASILPTPLVSTLAKQQSRTVDFATSNVRGAPFPVFLAGAKVLEIYPAGPTAGVAFNLTLISYDGSLDMGINADTAAIAEPELLGECVERAMTTLAGAASGQRPRSVRDRAVSRRPS